MRNAFAWLLAAGLLCANVAVADDGSPGVNMPVVDDGLGDLPGGGTNGWFFNPDDPPAPFPVEPPFGQPGFGQPWTSAANIATLNYWLSLVTESGDDPALLSELYGLGMISAPDQAAVSEALTSEEGRGGVPEPWTQGLLGGGLGLLGFYAAKRGGRVRRGLTCKNGSL